MEMGLAHLNSAMQPVMMAQKQNAAARQQVTDSAIQRREQEFSRTHQVMASTFDVMSHTLTARGGLVNLSA